MSILQAQAPCRHAVNTLYIPMSILQAQPHTLMSKSIPAICNVTLFMVLIPTLYIESEIIEISHLTFHTFASRSPISWGTDGVVCEFHFTSSLSLNSEGIGDIVCTTLAITITNKVSAHFPFLFRSAGWTTRCLSPFNRGNWHCSSTTLNLTRIAGSASFN